MTRLILACRSELDPSSGALSEKGRSDARHLAAYLFTHELIDHIYACSCTPAQETAAPSAELMGLSIHTDDRLGSPEELSACVAEIAALHDNLSLLLVTNPTALSAFLAEAGLAETDVPEGSLSVCEWSEGKVDIPTVGLCNHIKA